MSRVWTATDVKQAFQRGEKTLALPDDAILTDIAKEEAARLGMDVRRGGAPAPAAASAPAAAAPAAQPNFMGKIGFKDRMAKKIPMLGTFLQTAHPMVSEYVGRLGFDFIIIDNEHTPMSLGTVQTLLQGVAATPTLGVVRVPTIAYEYIAGSLDAGADALLIPQIRTAEDVQNVRDFCLYPPEGKRGIGPGRATDYGAAIGKAAKDPNAKTSIIIQIETAEALTNLDAIMSQDFFQMAFIGPGDLSMNLGIFGQFDHPKLLQEIDRVMAAARKYGKQIGIFAGNMDAAAKWVSKGMDLVVINSELGLLSQIVTPGLNKIRSGMGA